MPTELLLLTTEPLQDPGSSQTFVKPSMHQEAKAAASVDPEPTEHESPTTDRASSPAASKPLPASYDTEWAAVKECLDAVVYDDNSDPRDIAAIDALIELVVKLMDCIPEPESSAGINRSTQTP